MASSNSTHSKVIRSAQEEYFDFIDVLAFFWRARFFLMIGSVLGCAFAIIFAFMKKPPVFVTTLPVTIEVAGGVRPEEITAKFSSLIGREDILKAFEAKDIEFIGGQLPFALRNSPRSTTLEFRSKSSDPTGGMALMAAKVLADAAVSLNKKISASDISPIASKPINSHVEVNFAKLAEAQAREEAPLKIKLYTIEAELAQKTGMRPQPSAAATGASLGDDVLRLLAAVPTKVPDDEVSKIVLEYSELVGKIRAVQAKYEYPARELTKEMASLSSSLIGDTGGEAQKYPVIVVNEADYRAAVAAGTHERYENKLLFMAGFGILSGALFGTIASSLRNFVKKNQNRLGKVFA